MAKDPAQRPTRAQTVAPAPTGAPAMMPTGSPAEPLPPRSTADAAEATGAPRSLRQSMVIAVALLVLFSALWGLGVWPFDRDEPSAAGGAGAGIETPTPANGAADAATPVAMAGAAEATSTPTETALPTSTPDTTATVQAIESDIAATIQARDAMATADAATATANAPAPPPTATATPCPADAVLLQGRCATLTPTPTKTPTPAEPAAGTVREFGGIPFVYVPAGEFMMGSTDADINAALDLCNEFYGDCQRDWFVDEQPQHTVYLDGYWLMQTEVTNAQYTVCVDAGHCRAPDNDRWDAADYGDHPVTDVSWHDSVDYAAWLSVQTGRTIRLPTEAEWEKAARGTNARTFPWGDTWKGTLVNYCDRNCMYDWKDESEDDGFADTAPVGVYPDGASPYGALDMTGNLWEWTGDCHSEDQYAKSPSLNPTGPSCDDRRVVRGGAWSGNPSSARAANRVGDNPDDRFDNLGFRLASPDF